MCIRDRCFQTISANLDWFGCATLLITLSLIDFYGHFLLMWQKSFKKANSNCCWIFFQVRAFSRMWYSGIEFSWLRKLVKSQKSSWGKVGVVSADPSWLGYSKIFLIQPMSVTIEPRAEWLFDDWQSWCQLVSTVGFVKHDSANCLLFDKFSQILSGNSHNCVY